MTWFASYLNNCVQQVNSENAVSNPPNIFKVCHKVPSWVRPTLSSFYINDKRLLVPPRYMFMLMIQSSSHLAHIHPPSQPHDLHLCRDMYVISPGKTVPLAPSRLPVLMARNWSSAQIPGSLVGPLTFFLTSITCRSKLRPDWGSLLQQCFFHSQEDHTPYLWLWWCHHVPLTD